MSRLAKGLVLLPSALIALGLAFASMGFCINTSDSIPRGLYLMQQASIKPGGYVLFCPDNRQSFKEGARRGYLGHGFCPNQTGYLMKKVVAMTGDVVSSTSKGVSVNGVLLPFSKPQQEDGLHRSLKGWQVKNYRLKQNEILTMTNQNSLSFDGRYYGIINAGLIKGVITPIWVKQLEVNQ